MLIMVTTSALTAEQFKAFHNAIIQHPKVKDWLRNTDRQWFIEYDNADSDLTGFRDLLKSKLGNAKKTRLLLNTIHYYTGYGEQTLWDFIGKYHVNKAPNNKTQQQRAEQTQPQDKYAIKPEDFAVRDIMPLSDLTLDASTKQAVSAYFTRLDFYNAASAADIILPDSHRNILISGAPGVGKSTLAKAIGMQLVENVTRKKAVFFVKPAQVIGRYRGHTQRNMQEILDIAADGVVIFDEIDTYLDLDSDDKMALNVLNTHLGDRPNRPIIIATLYGTNRKRFFDFNQGFQSRFPVEIPLTGQDNSTLCDIFANAIAKTGMTINTEATKDVQDLLGELRVAKRGNFGHIREINNLIGLIIDHMAQRHAENKDDFSFDITRADIPEYDRISGVMIKKKTPPDSNNNSSDNLPKPRVIPFTPRG